MDTPLSLICGDERLENRSGRTVTVRLSQDGKSWHELDLDGDGGNLAARYTRFVEIPGVAKWRSHPGPPDKDSFWVRMPLTSEQEARIAAEGPEEIPLSLIYDDTGLQNRSGRTVTVRYSQDGESWGELELPTDKGSLPAKYMYFVEIPGVAKWRSHPGPPNDCSSWVRMPLTSEQEARSAAEDPEEMRTADENPEQSRTEETERYDEDPEEMRTADQNPEQNRTEKTERYDEDPEEMRTAFDHFDANKDGTMSVTELRNLLCTLDPDRWTDAKVNDLFGAIDSDSSGSLDIDEFVSWVHDVDAATKSKLMEKSVSRFTDFSHDPSEFSSALDGILDDSINPLVTFKQAVAAFPPIIKGQTKKEVWLAQKFARSSKGKGVIARYPGLDDQGAAAIHLYTAESPVYRVLNKQLRSQERGSSEFKTQWYPFTRILIEALRIVSDGEKAMINRGIPRNLVAEFPDVYKSGESLIWWSFSSCTNKIEVLANPMFLGTTGPRTIFQITTAKGAEISDFSALQGEAEHLLAPGVALKIDSIFPAGGGLTIIQCSDDEDAPDLLE